jgi:hypothetical protein
MFKKIIFILIISTTFFINSTFSADSELKTYKEEMLDAKTTVDNAQTEYNKNPNSSEKKIALDDATKAYDDATKAYNQSEESE